MITSSQFLSVFLECLLVSSFTIGVILLLKRLLKKHLTAQAHYNLWFLLLLALLVPLIPIQFMPFADSLSFLNSKSSLQSQTAPSAEIPLRQNNWMEDITVSVERYDLTLLNNTLFYIWISGVAILTLFTLIAMLKISKIKKHTNSLRNNGLLSLFEHCKHKLKITGCIIVGESSLVKTPMTFGLFKTYVVLPRHFDEWLSEKDIEYIFLHELSHYKNKDFAVNYYMVILQVLYWFNPLVWLAFRRMRLDREIACDAEVLNSLDEKAYMDYGNSIIHFANKASRAVTVDLANHLNGSKKQIKTRIEKIACFKPESKLLRWKSAAIFIFAGTFIAGQAPFISVMAHENSSYKFKDDNIIYEDLGNYFAGFDGSFVLYDKEADQYLIHNRNKSTLRVSPNSTYKIYSALLGLESGTITVENSSAKWNGLKYPIDSWNADQDLTSAIRNSVTWYFQSLDQQVQPGTIQTFLDRIRYGNRDLTGGIDEYWLESSLKISPVEQVQLLKKFYANQFGFKEKNIQTVKDSIKLERKEGALLSGKTGTGTVNGKNINGWFIGYVESGQDTYFFATNIQNEDDSNGSKAAEITLSILKQKGIY
ncbi:BlaR1 family beta-lactam sensor/signal transducer [Cytobacillus firmus]|uniref:BlaR1 family beta-lactam sensor/signal transducer n=1 Tax=Cytobacillus firmus TaxID=1399 RepID=UPI002161B9E2|nr:BlaR1 family beta-lactam sensor/signal transducer [Cytobacillus firmus]MCS0670235.1 BlaR1 family beta-lactam sensor/signal transducer [Cytobacillus firmus]